MEQSFLWYEMLVWGKEVFWVPVVGLKDRVGQVADWICENAPLLWTWSAPEAKSKGILYLWSFLVTFLKMVTRPTAYIINFVEMSNN